MTLYLDTNTNLLFQPIYLMLEQEINSEFFF